MLPVARIFYGEVRSNTETDQTMLEAQVFVGGAGGGGGGGGRISCLRLHFERFENLGISQTFNLQNYFFKCCSLFF